MTIPSKLYQFMPFSENGLTCLIQGLAFYGDHTLFNDPFDCDVGIENNLPLDELRKLWKSLVSGQEKTFFETMFLLDGNSAENDIDFMLKSIHERVRLKFKPKGVLCVSESPASTLMWGHYAAKHHGICLEYDLDADPRVQSRLKIAKLDYIKPSRVETSDLYRAYVERDQAAKEKIVEAYFFRKTPDWAYEKEWRVLRDFVGLGPTPGFLSGVFFGLHCSDTVKTTIVKLLARGKYPPKFYQMQRDPSSSASGVYASLGFRTLRHVDILNNDESAKHRDIALNRTMILDNGFDRPSLPSFSGMSGSPYSTAWPNELLW